MGERTDVVLGMGEVYATREPAVIQTVLGSCIAVCLRDPKRRVAGMNHFMLPARLDRDTAHGSTYYGAYAMDRLINELMKLGAVRTRLQAKVFGAADLLGLDNGARSIPTQNAAFILSYLQTDEIPLLAYDLGGTLPRAIHFFTDTGRVLLRQLGRQRLGGLVRQERQHERQILRDLAGPADITLFAGPDGLSSRARGSGPDD